MGIDFLDLLFQCEKQFNIKLDRHELAGLAKVAPYRRAWGESGTHDIRVRDFVAWVEKTIQSQNPDRENGCV